MPSKIKSFLLAEPSGWPATGVLFAGALIFLAGYVYFGVFGDSSTTYELFFVGAFALSGTAESLRPERRRMAGVLRAAAVLTLLSMMAIVAIAPEALTPF